MKKIVFALIAFLFVGNIAMAQNEISPERKKAIDSLALEKVRDLGKYIAVVGNKKTPFSEANRVIEAAVQLFMEGSKMQVSMLGRKQINSYLIKDYLQRLMRVNADKVEIEWFKIEYVSDLVRQPDGSYVGVITIFQKYSQYDNEKGLVYQDVTKKDITIYVKRKETQIGGRVVGFWDVLLGDIKVSETKRK